MQIIKDLETSKAETLTYFDLSDSALNKRYGPGKWTVRQVLNHLTDAETVLYERIRRTISKPNQVIWGFDPDAWCQGLEYEKFPLALNKPIYQSIRSSVIYLAAQYYDSLGKHSFVHNETGKRTLKDEFDKVAWHNEHHLKQIRTALSI